MHSPANSKLILCWLSLLVSLYLWQRSYWLSICHCTTSHPAKLWTCPSNWVSSLVSCRLYFLLYCSIFPENYWFFFAGYPGKCPYLTGFPTSLAYHSPVRLFKVWLCMGQMHVTAFPSVSQPIGSIAAYSSGLLLAILFSLTWWVLGQARTSP